MDIIKAIIPAAGLGTRFLSFTKSVPKEMLPIINKPAIQYIIEEGIRSEIKNFIIITSKNKQAIANHFDLDLELELTLKENNKKALLDDLNKLMREAQFTYIRQPEPLGLGHAVWLARNSIGKEYFGIFLPDDIITAAHNPALMQLIRIARQEKASVIAVQEVPVEYISSYGVIKIKKQITPKLFQVADVVEKPLAKNAPSNLAIIGRYVLSHKIFSALEETASHSQGEIQLTDAIGIMAKNGEKVFAYKIQGIRYDIGTPIGWLKANLGMALQDPLYATHLKKFLADLDSPNSFMFEQDKVLEHMR